MQFLYYCYYLFTHDITIAVVWYWIPGITWCHKAVSNFVPSQLPSQLLVWYEESLYQATVK